MPTDARQRRPDHGHVEILNGKGGKSRTVRAERSTVRAIWRYLETRPEDLPDDAPLFASTVSDGREEEKSLSRFAVLRLLKRLGARAKVKDVNIHSASPVANWHL